MTVRMRTIDYQEGDVVLSGELAWDDAWTSPRPAVVIVHDAMKSTGGFEEGRAATLAGRGYAGFVLDVYGKGVHGRDFDESLALMTPFQQDRAALLRRLQAGRQAARGRREAARCDRLLLRRDVRSRPRAGKRPTARCRELPRPADAATRRYRKSVHVGSNRIASDRIEGPRAPRLG